MVRSLRRGIASASAALLLFLLGGGTELRAQNEGTTLRQGPDQPVSRVGTRGANFLEIGIGARATALAGAGTVISEGVDALYWNPAGAALLEGFAVGGSYTELFANSGIELFYFGSILPALGGSVGISVNTLSSGEIPRTTELTPSTENVGVGSTFEWNSSALSAHYARRITDRLALGASLKWINEGIEGADANWVGVDIGAKFETGLYGIVIGAMVANVGGRAAASGPLVQQNRTAATEVFETGRTLGFALLTDEMALPTYARFGLQLDLTGVPEALVAAGDPRHRVTTFIDVRDAVDTDIQSSIAFEYSYDEMLFIRGGKQFANEVGSNRGFNEGLSVGGGVRLPVLDRRLSIDYAYTALLRALDHNQVISVEFGW